MPYVFYNPNPSGNMVGDCVIRAISKITHKDWETTYINIALKGYEMHNMPSANSVWGAYLKSIGFEQNLIQQPCPDCYSVRDFCIDYPDGEYILATGSHVVAVVNGEYYDSWDSGDEIPIYYWFNKGDK